MNSQSSVSKRRRLLALRKRIIKEVVEFRWEDAWFFPRWRGVAGLRGTAPIMFVGLNPSTGVFPSEADKVFYRTLHRCGFRNAHLTDVMKTRRRGQSVDELFNDRGVLRGAKGYFKEEIDIVRPKLIVYLGPSFERHFEVFQKITPSIPSLTIPHYSPQVRRDGWESEFRAWMRWCVRECYRTL